jgi:hypothetical protein
MTKSYPIYVLKNKFLVIRTTKNNKFDLIPKVVKSIIA